jgi:hypothetical protein
MGHPRRRRISPPNFRSQAEEGWRGEWENTTTHGPSFQVKTCEKPPERTCASASGRVKAVISIVYWLSRRRRGQGGLAEAVMGLGR